MAKVYNGRGPKVYNGTGTISDPASADPWGATIPDPKYLRVYSENISVCENCENKEKTVGFS